MSEFFHPGLQGVIAGETEICRLDGKFQYRGYDVGDLVQGAGFLEVVYLLLFDDLPTEDELADFLGILYEEQELPSLVQLVFEQLPVHATVLEALRTGISLLGHFDPQPEEDLLHCGHAQSIRMLAKVPMMIGLWYQLRCGQSPLSPDPDLSFIGNLYRGIQRTAPCALHEDALETALITVLEHEFNPSSYVARIVGSTRTNQYGPILAALDAFIGADHRGGDDRPLDLLDSASHAADSEAGLISWVNQLPQDAVVPGFGHPVHSVEDPRVPLLNPICSHLAEACGRLDMEAWALSIQRCLWESRRLAPNVDWPLSRLFAYLGLPRELFRALFACARLVGWSAHAVEQCESNVVIRPRARYRGAEDCPFEPMRRRAF